MSPAAPFFSDRLYQDLNSVTQKESFSSVHLSCFPVKEENHINQILLERTHLAQQVTRMVFSLRKKENIKVRQPLQKIMIPVLDEINKTNLEAIIPIIKQEVNVKQVQLLNTQETSSLLVKAVKPNFKTLGPKLGKDLKRVSQELQAFSNEQIQEFEKNGKVIIQGYELTLEDMEIRTQDITGWLVTSDGRLTVALDITLTPELKSEGIARELVNRIQNLRKDNGLEVTDKISLEIQANEEIEKAVKENEQYICSETLTRKLTFSDNISGGTELDIDEIKVNVSLKKL
jgi:isoleucyl-tRNA synthetase